MTGNQSGHFSDAILHFVKCSPFCSRLPATKVIGYRHRSDGLWTAKRAYGNLQGAEYVVDFLPKVRIDVAIKDELLDPVLDAITKAAHTGKIGDGKIFVFELEQVVRIRTGETDGDAL